MLRKRSNMLRHTTDQMMEWAGSFGRNYTDRNFLSFDKFEMRYQSTFGTTRSALNERFLGSLNRTIRILEVGSNVGLQLLCLQKLGFTNLFGLELQSYALHHAKKHLSNVCFLQGSVFDIPFRDNGFDLVFTSGVLIHIAPVHLPNALREIYRCAKEYIWGFEYWSNHSEEIVYRRRPNLLWKADYGQIYRQLFPDLVLLKEERLKHLDSANIDSMFLLRKRN